MFFIYRQLTNTRRGRLRQAHHMITVMTSMLSPWRPSTTCFLFQTWGVVSQHSLLWIVVRRQTEEVWMPVTCLERERRCSLALVTAYPYSCTNAHPGVCVHVCEGIWGMQPWYTPAGAQNSISDTLLHCFPPCCIVLLFSKLGWPHGTLLLQLKVLVLWTRVQPPHLYGVWGFKIRS